MTCTCLSTSACRDCHTQKIYLCRVHQSLSGIYGGRTEIRWWLTRLPCSSMQYRSFRTSTLTLHVIIAIRNAHRKGGHASSLIVSNTALTPAQPSACVYQRWLPTTLLITGVLPTAMLAACHTYSQAKERCLRCGLTKGAPLGPLRAPLWSITFKGASCLWTLSLDEFLLRTQFIFICRQPIRQ